MYIYWIKVVEFGIKSEIPNFALPTGGPKRTQILKEQL